MYIIREGVLVSAGVLVNAKYSENDDSYTNVLH